MADAAIAIECLPERCTQIVDFGGSQIAVTSVPDPFNTIDVTAILRDPNGFHGSRNVHDVIEFGGAFRGLIGTHDSSKGLFADRDALPDKGVFVLSDHDTEAAGLVQGIDELAQRVIDDQSLYDDPRFCEDYLALARAGFSLVAKHISVEHNGTPVSLERAGLVTTRLAAGLDRDAEVPGEIRVVTKRAHHKNAPPEELMVTVKWRDLSDIARMGGEVIEIADFVNPASGASALALIVAAQQRGATSSTVIHKSFMATEQGIEFSRSVLQGGGIESFFYTLGTSNNLSPQYYLFDPAVADAGDALRSNLPTWYKP